MTVKNFMEDIVTAIIDEVLEEKKKDSDYDSKSLNRDDIITYVLNRVSPKYYTSERGILHGKLESEILFQQRTDILLLAEEAINTIRERRESEAIPEVQKRKDECYLPHILGEVLEESTYSIIPDIEVTLFYQGKPAEMIEPSWKNPYITNKATRGFFHFWPKIPPDTGETSEISFLLKFSNPRFEEKTLEFGLEMMDNCSSYRSHIIPVVMLKVRKGVDISFLNE